nr:MAG TPA: LabA protein [Bacteriophage sp.]
MKSTFRRVNYMKIRFKDLLFNNEEIELDVKDIIIMTGDQDETILIENVDGVFYKVIVIEFV